MTGLGTHRWRVGLVKAAAVALLVVPLLAMGLIVARYLEFRAAAEGDVGTHGTAVVEKARTVGRGDDVCVGEFTPDDGGTPIEVDIEVDGFCSDGDRHEAFLVEPAPLHPNWWGRPTAWTDGTGAGEHLAPLLPVFLFLVVPPWAVVVIFRRRLWQALRARS
jgi:hypothetical protein